jgi:hypothetical protein
MKYTTEAGPITYKIQITGIIIIIIIIRAINCLSSETRGIDIVHTLLDLHVTDKSI